MKYFLIIFATFVIVISHHLVSSQDSVYWEHIGNDVGGTKYSPLEEINLTNVGGLVNTWTYRWADRPQELTSYYRHQCTPIMVDDGSGTGTDLLIFCLPWRKVVALNPASGTEAWINTDAYDNSSRNCRGVETWLDSQKADGELCRRVIYMPTKDLRLMAVDAATGLRCPEFGDNGFLNISVPFNKCGGESYCYWYDNPPVIIGDMLSIGAGTTDTLVINTPKGRLPGYHARTGQKIWQFFIIPIDPNDPAMATWHNGTDGIGSGNVWAFMSGDSSSNLFYAPTSESAGDHQGTLRPGDNYYCNGVLALNATTGERVWFRQLVHHDLWDYDINSQPVVAEITKGGQKRKVIIQGTKMGLIFVLDAATGEPVYEIEERPVPKSTVPGEISSPTQPFPKDTFLQTAQMSLDMTEGNDLWGYTDEDKQYCKDVMLNNVQLQGSIYDPPDMDKGRFWIPGNHGGQHLTGLSVDPKRGIAVVPVNHHPCLCQLMPLNSTEEQRPSWCKSMDTIGGLPYIECCTYNIMDQNNRPCHKPVWGRIMALNLNEGYKMWERPNGFLPNLPDTYGTRWYLGGVIITGSGLIFVGNTEDRYFRALDIENGNILWQSPEPMAAHAAGTPITYRTGGKQYVVIMAGGAEMNHETVKIRSDHLYAFTLPDQEK